MRSSVSYTHLDVYKRQEHGGVKTHQTLPKDADALAEVLSKQKSRRDRLPEAERTEALSPLPVAELRKYEAVKEAHPDALVCFAQNGYFELYGKDCLLYTSAKNMTVYMKRL